MKDDSGVPARTRWARLRFEIIGPLLASPPGSGELQSRLVELASKSYLHPTKKEMVRFGVSTIERWYYQAIRNATDPVAALERKVHGHAGKHPSMRGSVRDALRRQHQQHPGWTYKLHYDNLVALAEMESSIDEIPSYTTVTRFMKDEGLRRQKVRRRQREGTTSPIIEVRREQRSFEVTHVHGLWHLDFHVGRRRILSSLGEWLRPILFGVLDDRARLCCHLQWYCEETTEVLVHGFCQAIQKRGLPRALLTDNGAAMLAAETREGLERLGIVHETTQPYSPEQNAKQEVFWAQVEGRLMPMLEGEKELTLPKLNEATQAWVELEYNRSIHSETGQSPIERFLGGPSVGRQSPDSDTLRRAFRKQEIRTQRKSDGTVTVEGVRFEVPSRYRSLDRLCIRVARWDLSSIDLVDERRGTFLCSLLPVDKQRNADGRRRTLESTSPADRPVQPSGTAPLLRKLIADYAATGLPPAYLPHSPIMTDDDTTENDDQCSNKC